MNDHWELVARLFEEVADLATAERESVLDRACAGDGELRRDVASLAENLKGSEDFFCSFVNASGLDRAGNYRLVRQIGVGGMGAVYLAIRDDGQFTHQVAIKFANIGTRSEWALERFRSERQVLANLSHPHIARLLDGGTMRGGIPYLVMEYIDGCPITTFCCRHRLSTDKRLQLFDGVLKAVAHAHKNLVVHRDIKPANILVTADGVPKLLDFGISKLLGTSGRNSGAATVLLMTPAYASPEQLRGDTVTTLTDVYSLGAVLRELVTGSSHPGPPGSIPGEIGSIISMAVREEPEERYSSVEQLAFDIQNYLRGRPVLACKNTVRYRARKFMGRHMAGVVASVLLVLTIGLGIAGVLWQARRVAVQIARAEHRFGSLRKMANAFLFDFHTRIQNMKDISEARDLVLNTGLEYIDTLARDAANDPLLQRELARAYEKFGDLQGFRHEAAMGRPADALASYRKAIAFAGPIAENDPMAAVLLSRSWCSAGEMIERVSGDLEEAKRSHRRCIQAAERVTAKTYSSRRLESLVRGHLLLGEVELRFGNPSAAMGEFTGILSLIAATDAINAQKLAAYAAEVHDHIGQLRYAMGDRAMATRSFLAALGNARRLAPEISDPAGQRTLARVLLHLATCRADAGGQDLTEAQALVSEAVAHARHLVSVSPQHPLYNEDLAVGLALRERISRLQNSVASR